MLADWFPAIRKGFGPLQPVGKAPAESPVLTFIPLTSVELGDEVQFI